MVEHSTVRLKLRKVLARPGSLRELGKVLRGIIKSQWEEGNIVELDFEGETIASGSLFDEIAKLFDEFPKEDVKRSLRFVNIDRWDERLIVHLSRLRLKRENRRSNNEHSG